MQQLFSKLFMGVSLLMLPVCVSCSNNAEEVEEVEEKTTHGHYVEVHKSMYGEATGESVEITGIAHADHFENYFSGNTIWYIETEDGSIYYVDGYSYTPTPDMLAAFAEGATIQIAGDTYFIYDMFMEWFRPEMQELKKTTNLYVMDLWNCTYQRLNSIEIVK